MLDSTIMQKLFPILPDITMKSHDSEILVKTDPNAFGEFMAKFQDLHFKLIGMGGYVSDLNDVLTEVGLETEEFRSELYRSVETYCQIPVQTRDEVLGRSEKWGRLFAAYNTQGDYEAFKDGAREIAREALSANSLANHHMFFGGRDQLYDYYIARYGTEGFRKHGLSNTLNHEMEHFGNCLEAAKAIGKENLNPWLGVMFSLGQRHFDMSYCHSFFEREVREDRISEEHFNTYRKIAFGQPTNPSDGDKLMSDLVK